VSCPAFTGAVLTGGASRRMGRDKATQVKVDDQPLAARLADTLRSAGAAEVLAIGGALGALGALGLDARADQYPGEGPLGGILTALLEAAHPLVVVVACDLVSLDAPSVARLVDVASRAASDAVLARADRLEPLCGAWWSGRCRPALERAFAGGERAVHRALSELAIAEVSLPPEAVRNVNRLEDLPDR
jgi:molybdopterin-guanine dinucleotide biosynthesis protein A